MYSLIIKVDKTGKKLKSVEEIESFVGLITADSVVKNFESELATCVKKGWVVNRSRKTVSDDGFSLSIFSKTLSNLKSFQDFLESSENFKTIVTGLRNAGAVVSTDFSQELDEIGVYELNTHLVSDILLD